MRKQIMRVAVLALVAVVVLNGVGNCSSFPWKKVIGGVAIVGGACLEKDGNQQEDVTSVGYDGPYNSPSRKTIISHYTQAVNPTEAALGVVSMISGVFLLLFKDENAPEKVALKNQNTIKMNFVATASGFQMLFCKKI